MMDTKHDPTEPAPLLLDAAEVARMLGISKATVWRLRDAGKLPAPVMVGSLVRWRRSAVETWIANGCPALASRHATK